MIPIVRGAALGLVLGAATGIPLGVVNLSVIEAAARAGRRRATAIGIGGAIADAIHAGLAFVGVAPVLDEHPDALKILAAISAAIVIAYAIVVVRGRTHAKPRAGGVLVGLALTLPNPAPLAAWIAFAGALLPGAPIDVGIAAAIGVGVGSAAWFAVLAHIVARGRSSPIATRRLPSIVALVFVAIAIAALVRAWR